MTWEQATFAIGVIVLAVQGFQAYITMGVKLWTRENFVAKEDMSTYLAPLKDAITIRRSADRLENL